MHKSSNVPSAEVLQMAEVIEHIQTGEEFVNSMHTRQDQHMNAGVLDFLERILNTAKDTYMQQLRNLSPEDREVLHTLINN